VRRLRPDVIYALLNWQAVPFAHHVLKRNPGVPFVWHLKEGPLACHEQGTWDLLVDLCTRSDGQVYSSPEMKAWLDAFLPPRRGADLSMVLDGDLPKADWFDGEPARRLSDSDGECHTVVCGRPIGLDPGIIGDLSSHGIHVHLHGTSYRHIPPEWLRQAQALGAGRFHVHPHVHQDHWVSELSRYDAGWLHFFRSSNGGEVQRLRWPDMNYPARLATLAAAGVPWLQRDNSGHTVATQAVARELEVGIFWQETEALAQLMRDRAAVDRARASMWRNRHLFTFDHHADRLLEFFRTVVAARPG
jgi:hypothetical protein